MGTIEFTNTTSEKAIQYLKIKDKATVLGEGGKDEDEKLLQQLAEETKTRTEEQAKVAWGNMQSSLEDHAQSTEAEPIFTNSQIQRRWDTHMDQNKPFSSFVAETIVEEQIESLRLRTGLPPVTPKNETGTNLRDIRAKVTQFSVTVQARLNKVLDSFHKTFENEVKKVGVNEMFFSENPIRNYTTKDFEDIKVEEGNIIYGVRVQVIGYPEMRNLVGFLTKDNNLSLFEQDRSFNLHNEEGEVDIIIEKVVVLNGTNKPSGEYLYPFIVDKETEFKLDTKEEIVEKIKKHISETKATTERRFKIISEHLSTQSENKNGN